MRSSPQPSLLESILAELRSRRRTAAWIDDLLHRHERESNDMDKNLSEINTHLQDALAHCLRTADAIADCKPADAALSALQMSFAINKAESLMHSVRRQILKQVDTAASS